MTTIFKRIKSALSGSANGKGSSNAVIDAASLFEAQHGNGRPRLPEQVQLLNRLADFANKEGISLTAVFDSRALRESPNGELYKEVLTYYTNQEKKVADVVQHGVNKRGGDCIVVTSNKEVEAAMAASGTTIISAVTFKKALDTALGKPKSGGGNNRRSNNSGGGNGGGRRNNNRRSGGGRRNKNNDENRGNKKQSNNNPEKDPILDLIDPL